MILSKIVCHGFKSFAKKLELKFDGQITAIVGPNGCGKTNIVDAIRWGLGEQRPSVLRTDRMENVIFGGAHSSKPLGMAEVSVSFDNRHHILPIDYNEVVITRRLYRSGESEYLLNKNQVRLKDINDLIMDTGIGADAYSVIELRMVEDILSERAEDRRKLLEEAAGVTKYKHRLRAALRKLDTTRNDLLRVNDIIQEVERNVSSLHRQVQKAKRYQVHHDRLQELDVQRSVQLLRTIGAQLDPLKKDLGELEKQKEGRSTEITREEADLEAMRAQQVEKEKALVKVREELAEVVEKIHRREGDIRVGKERVTSLSERVTRYTDEVGTLEKRLEEQKSHLDVTTRNREALQVKITSAGRIFNNKKKALEVFQQGLNLKRLELNEKKREIIECLETSNRLNSEETQLRTKIDNNQGRLERLDEEDAASREARKKALDTQKELEAQHRDRQKQRNQAAQKFRKTSGALKKAEEELDAARQNLYRDKSELELRQGRLAFLQSVVESREGLFDGARKLLKENVPGLQGVLADLLDCDASHRKAVEVGLGDAAQYLVFDSGKSALAALNRLKQWGGGRVSMLGLDRIQTAPDLKGRPPVKGQPGVIGWAADLVSCGDALTFAVAHLLGEVLVVEDLEAANRVSGGFKGAQSAVRVATLDGELVTGWGALQAGSRDEKDVGMVGRTRRIGELEDDVKRRARAIEGITDRLDKLEKNRADLIRQKEEEEKQIQQIETLVHETEKQQAKVRVEEEMAESGMRANANERQKLLEEIEKSRDTLEDLRPRMESLQDKRESLEASSGHIQSEVERLETEENEKEEEVHRLNLSVVRLNGEAKNLDYDIQRSRNLIQEIAESKEQRSREIDEAREQIQVQEGEVAENEKALVDDYSVKEKVEEDQLQKEQDYQDLMQEVQELEKEVREVRRDRDAASDRIHNMRMEISELEHQTSSLKERIWENYEVRLEKVKPSGEEPLDLDAAGEEIEDLRRKMKNMGPVNLAALREYEQEKERADFLQQQRRDLIAAEETLKETIQKINRTARQRFGEVFELVRKNFQETFRRFFQGGEADLRLPEGEDPLEAQVEIIARPAGKHFRDLTLLSGGERALTAISLLFALYQVKPSPFCILDEIDAPLDDANVDRFTRVLQEFAEKTQFVIVTHNRMTMRVAKTLYGVTMEEEGVSRVVSVKFEDEIPEQAA
jgi:chromosome segregation protein